MDNEGWVKNRDALANLALQKLGITNFGVSVGDKTIKNTSVVGYRVELPYGVNSSHFVLTGTDKSLVYNPGHTYTSDQSKWKKIVEVFVYGK